MAYPASLDNLPTNKGNLTDASTGSPTGGTAGDHASAHNLANAAINNIEAELGLDPSGPYATLALRLATFAPFVAFAGGDAGKAAIWDGTQFVPDVARELAYAEVTTSFSTTSTTPVDSPLGSINVPPTSGPILLEFYCPYTNHNVANGSISAFIMETTSGTVERARSIITGPGAVLTGGPQIVKRRLAASAVTRSFKVQISQAGGGTGATWIVDVGGAAYFKSERA